jgi:hypothetical protein
MRVGDRPAGVGSAAAKDTTSASANEPLASSCLNQPELSAGELAMDSGAADGRARPANWSVAGWSIGLVLYLLLVSVILLQWLTVPMTPVALGSPYWILMGATA